MKTLINKSLAALVSAAVLAVLLCVNVQSIIGIEPENPENFVSGDYTYQVNNGEATIVSYNGTVLDLTLPEELDGYPVTAIGYQAFNGSKGCQNLTSLAIPENIKYIGASVFCYLPNLVNITLHDGIMSIGRNAFYGTACYQSQPAGVVYIGNYALGCKYAIDIDWDDSSIVLKDGTIGVADEAFFYNESLHDIVLPESLIWIGKSAFEGTEIRDITIPKSVISIEHKAFEPVMILWPEPVPEIRKMNIRGYKDSAAHAYATEYKHPFFAIDVPPYNIGDIDGNGIVDAADAAHALKIYALIQTQKPVNYSEAALLAADAYQNNVIDVMDAALILRFYAYVQTGGKMSAEEFFSKR